MSSDPVASMQNLRCRRLAWILASLSSLACGSSPASGKVPEPGGSDGSLVGNPAPDFSVSALSGGRGTVSLRALRGQVVLLDFWGTFCEPCKKSFPKLQELYARWSAKGLKIVGISEDESDDKDKIAPFGRTYGAKFMLGWDEDKLIARAYSPPSMPSTFLIDKKGVVRFAHVGFREGEEVQVDQEIKELLDQ